jgi:penicillin amidase
MSQHLTSLCVLCVLCGQFLPAATQKTLAVKGETVTIVRDPYGVPHIFAPSEYSLYYANGYAVAEDRMWQLERYRYDATGRMAEIDGKPALARDRELRRRIYTPEEMRQQLDRMDPQLRQSFQAYADGVNARIAEGRLPPQFAKHGLQPVPWTVLDSMAICTATGLRFGSGGGGELENLKILRKLKQKFGDEKARAIFNDLWWRNDPKSPTTIGNEDMPAPAWTQAPTGTANWSLARLPLSDGVLERADEAAGMRHALAYNAEAGLPTRWGSYAIVLGPSKTITGNAILIGGPQMGFSTPQIAHEIHLNGPGINAMGMGFAGIPGVLIGRNEDLAWTTTSGIDDLQAGSGSRTTSLSPPAPATSATGTARGALRSAIWWWP